MFKVDYLFNVSCSGIHTNSLKLYTASSLDVKVIMPYVLSSETSKPVRSYFALWHGTGQRSLSCAAESCIVAMKLLSPSVLFVRMCCYSSPGYFTERTQPHPVGQSLRGAWYMKKGTVPMAWAIRRFRLPLPSKNALFTFHWFNQVKEWYRLGQPV